MAADTRSGTSLSLGMRIRRAREALGLTQEELGARVQRSVRAVNDWENDRTEPKNSIGALEKHLMVDLSGLDGHGDQARIISPRLRRVIREELDEDDQRRVIGVLEGTVEVIEPSEGASGSAEAL